MNKILLKTEADFNTVLRQFKRDATDAHILEQYPPDKYPCVLCYYEQDADSIAYANWLHSEYVYPSDFEGDAQ